MTTANPTAPTLQTIADQVFSPSGTIGYLTILSADLATSLEVVPNTSTDILAAVSNHGLVTGSRVRVASTSAVPSGLTTSVDYYAIVFTTTNIKLATTLANALAGTAIDLTDAGSGTISINEQPLTQSDTPEVIINKEIQHAGWPARLDVTDVGSSAGTITEAAKTPITIAFTNTDTNNIVYGHVVYIAGGSASISDLVGILGIWLTTEAASVTIVASETKNFVINIKVRPYVASSGGGGVSVS
jgi:hypothetical protein